VRVLSRPEVVIFLREHLFDFELDEYRPLGNPTRFLGALAALFSRCKDEDISTAAFVAHAEALRAAASAAEEAIAARAEVPADERAAAEALADEARRRLELARAYERYNELLGGGGFVDFGDQVALALRLVRESAAARRALQGRYRYILVDEFQDTNRAQAELVALLAEMHRNVTVVGDDDQSIYKFRGAAISNILEFQARYRTARTVVLRRNYRSRAPILDASYRLIRFNDPDRLEVRSGVVKRLRAERPGSAAVPVRLEAFGTGSEEADWVAAEIARRIEGGARPRDHAVLVRANSAADPILRALNVAGVPWRFSGASGLYARPEVRLLLSFVRAVADLSSSVDVYALAASDVYGLGGEDLTTIVTTARRRHRSIFDVLDEVDRQPGILRLSASTRAAASRLVADLRAYTALAHDRSAGEVLFAFLKGSGLLARYAAAETVALEEAVQNVARFFEIVRAQSALLADDRIAFVAPHLATLIEAGDDPATADIDPEADAVAVLTVHKAKGLEWSTVFLAGLVAGRFPATERREPLPVPIELAREELPTGDGAIQEERRLFYVGMTRARDELILSYAVDYGGGRARKVSPFVLEALDLPAAEAGASGRAGGPLERLAAFEPVEPPAETAREPVEGPLSLSFYAIDDYLTCPAKYRYSHLLRVPLAPHHSIIYGAALHLAVQEFHRKHARGIVMTEAELDESFTRAWSNEGFLSREHEEARLEAGRAALRRFRAEQLEPGAVIPTYVEREFTFSLDGDRIRGRWDRVDVEPVADGEQVAHAAEEPITGKAAHGPRSTDGSPQADVVTPTLPLLGRERVTITDYKSSDVRDPSRARQRARDSLQLQLYAMAYEAQTGRLPDAVQLQFLETGLIGRAEVEPKRLARARQQIRTAAAGIRSGDFSARPDTLSCTYCGFREICPSSVAR
jgi:DNA helicase-2/ATP-dependent DNA helicase PcrA